MGLKPAPSMAALQLVIGVRDVRLSSNHPIQWRSRAIHQGRQLRKPATQPIHWEQFDQFCDHFGYAGHRTAGGDVYDPGDRREEPIHSQVVFHRHQQRRLSAIAGSQGQVPADTLEIRGVSAGSLNPNYWQQN